MTKRIIASFLALALSFSLVACGSDKKTEEPSKNPEATATGDFPAGTFEGTAKGYGGDLKVAVTLDTNGITNVEVVEHGETEGIGSNAVDKLPSQIVETQSIDLDIVSGATVSSNAILSAVAAALETAGVDTALLKGKDVVATTAEPREIDVDVVVVGAGGAGISAAIEAYDAGASVVVLEKMSFPGGNTIKASGGMNAAETHIHELRGGGGKGTTKQEFYDYTFEGGHQLADPELLHYFVDNSASAVKWLSDLGVNYTWNEGDEVAISHTVNNGGPIGVELMRVFTEQLSKRDIELLTETTANQLLMDGKDVKGIVATGANGETITINAGSVVLATGGFGANLEMCAEYNPQLVGYVTTNHPGATGDGIVLAQQAGADLTDIEQIQIHPTVEQTTAELVSESLRRDGSILINSKGERFFNETSTRDKVSAAILEQEDEQAYILFDQGVRDVRKIIEQYIDQGFVLEAETLEELAGKMNVDPETLVKTVADWNICVENEADPTFNRESGFNRKLENGPYYAILISPGIHHTMGGVKIDVNTHVIGTDGEIIPGLFAAGEVTGGIHGGNRIGGNAIADIVIFGREAGTESANYAKGGETSVTEESAEETPAA